MQVRRLPDAVARHRAKLVKLQLLRPGDVAPSYKRDTGCGPLLPARLRVPPDCWWPAKLI